MNTQTELLSLESPTEAKTVRAPELGVAPGSAGSSRYIWLAGVSTLIETKGGRICLTSGTHVCVINNRGEPKIISVEGEEVVAVMDAYEAAVRSHRNPPPNAAMSHERSELAP